MGVHLHVKGKGGSEKECVGVGLWVCECVCVRGYMWVYKYMMQDVCLLFPYVQCTYPVHGHLLHLICSLSTGPWCVAAQARQTSQSGVGGMLVYTGGTLRKVEQGGVDVQGNRGV